MAVLIAGSLMLVFLNAATSADITGNWKADISKTSPPDEKELAVTLTIRGTGRKSYLVEVDRMTADRGDVQEQIPFTCDGGERTQGSSGVPGATVFCPAGGPPLVRIRHSDGTLRELAFRVSEDGSSLTYVNTVAGHDRTYTLSRQ
jgi:hypothetical protein